MLATLGLKMWACKFMRRSALAMIMLYWMLSGHAAFAVERVWPGLAQETISTFTSGLEYIQGDYGTGDDTELWRIPLIYTVRQGPWAVTAASSLLSAESSGDIVIDDKMASKRSVSTGTQSASGIGDVWLSGSYYFATQPDHSYRVTALLKLGTASESDGLGTGETDYALEGAASRRIDQFTLSFMLGYEINGDSPLYDYDDYLYGSVGLSTPLPNKRRVGASVYLAESAAAGGEAPVEVTGYYRQPVARVGRASELYLYVTLGLSDGSPDSALGALLQFRL